MKSFVKKDSIKKKRENALKNNLKKRKKFKNKRETYDSTIR